MCLAYGRTKFKMEKYRARNHHHKLLYVWKSLLFMLIIYMNPLHHHVNFVVAAAIRQCDMPYIFMPFSLYFILCVRRSVNLSPWNSRFYKNKYITHAHNHISLEFSINFRIALMKMWLKYIRMHKYTSRRAHTSWTCLISGAAQRTSVIRNIQLL